MQKNIYNFRFETLTHRQQEEEIERGHEGERESSFVPIFLPSNFGIVRIFAGWDSLIDWFLVNRKGFEPGGINYRVYGHICFNWVKGL